MLKGKKFDAFALFQITERTSQITERPFRITERTFQATERRFLHTIFSFSS